MIKKVSQKKKYSQAFKEQILEYLEHSPKNIAEVSKEFGVPYPNIVRWKKDNEEKKSPSKDIEDSKRLNLEIIRLQKENEILKKADVFFAKNLD
jgi:transposase